MGSIGSRHRFSRQNGRCRCRRRDESSYYCARASWGLCDFDYRWLDRTQLLCTTRRSRRKAEQEADSWSEVKRKKERGEKTAARRQRCRINELALQMQQINIFFTCTWPRVS